MSQVSGGGNYISDGQIMAWLANQQDRLYDDLRSSMDLSGARADFTDELNTIKTHLQQANEKKDFSQVDAELQAFIGKYGSDPNFAELCKGIDGIAQQVHEGAQAGATYAQTFAKFEVDSKNYSAQMAHLAASPGALANALQQHNLPAAPEEPTRPEPQHYSADTLKSWETLIDGKGDLANKNDQLTMIHIQELKASLDQAAQLGSTFISSGDKTSSAIINNIA